MVYWPCLDLSNYGLMPLVLRGLRCMSVNCDTYALLLILTGTDTLRISGMVAVSLVIC